MFFIIMMYSAAIPALYIAGLLICFSMYWSDKILFLRHYRLPPRYGRDLASRSNKIMMFAMILHLFTGVYMLSNRDILSYKGSEEYFGKNFVALLAKGIEALFGVDQERFIMPHTVAYVIGICIFLLCFISELSCGIMTKLIYCCCCSCLDL